MAGMKIDPYLEEITTKFAEMDRVGIKVFSRSDLSMIFGFDKPGRSRNLLHWLQSNGTLERVARGIYVNPSGISSRVYLIEEIACVLRRGHFNYVSLESILSEFGVISQIMIDRITVMTTGPRGVFKTPYGTIEFTHTSRSLEDLLASTIYKYGRPLRLATKNAGISDLRRVGRNVNMLDPSEI